MPNYTFDQAKRITLDLLPGQAISGTAVNRLRCITPLFTCIDGKDLAMVAEKGKDRYGAGYVRVSSERQKVHGMSPGEQVSMQMSHFISKGEAFCIYNDAGLKGALPFYEPTLLQEMVDSRIDFYNEVFEAVILNPLRTEKQSRQTIDSIIKYRERHEAQIRKQHPITEKDLAAKINKNANFRPALTAMLNDAPVIHTVVINDLSRLSRNQNLFSAIAKRLSASRTRILGTVENLDFVNQKGLGPELQTFFFSLMAEHKLREVLSGVLRGQLEKLSEGKPCGRLPVWLTQDKNGYATLVSDEAAEAVKAAIDWYVDDGCTITALVTRLNNEFVCPPRKTGKNPGKRTWTIETVETMLFTKAAAGFEEEFGMEWKMFPALISEERYQQILARRDNTDNQKYSFAAARNQADFKTKYLATGLMLCPCHSSLSEGRGGAIVKKPCADSRKDAYVCGSTRRKPEMRHISLNSANVEKFINDLIKTAPDIFLSVYKQEQSYQTLQETLQDTEKRIIETQAQTAIKRKEIECEAEAKARNVSLPGSKGWSTVVEGIIEDMLEETGLDSSINKLITQRDDLRKQITDYVPDDFVSTIEERIARWDTMEVWKQNELLLAIFDKWHFRRINDDDTNLEVVMILKGGRELPPVQIQCSPCRKAISRISRRFPTASEYKQSVIAWYYNKKTEQN